MPIDLLDQVNESGSAKVDEISTTAGLVLTYDPTTKPFDNPKVREAFDYAINKPLILQQILKGQGEVLQGQLLTKGVLGVEPGPEGAAVRPGVGQEDAAGCGVRLQHADPDLDAERQSTCPTRTSATPWLAC